MFTIDEIYISENWNIYGATCLEQQQFDYNVLQLALKVPVSLGMQTAYCSTEQHLYSTYKWNVCYSTLIRDTSISFQWIWLVYKTPPFYISYQWHVVNGYGYGKSKSDNRFVPWSGSEELQYQISSDDSNGDWQWVVRVSELIDKCRWRQNIDANDPKRPSKQSNVYRVGGLVPSFRNRPKFSWYLD